MRAVLVALLVVVIGVAGCGSQPTANTSSSPTSARPSPSPSLDAAHLAYLAVIEADGSAYDMAHNAGATVCNPGAPLAQNHGCNSALNLRVAQTLQKLQSDLTKLQPPPDWANDHKVLLATLPAAISALQAVAKAYDEGNSPAYVSAQTAYAAAAAPIQSALGDIDPSLSFG